MKKTIEEKMVEVLTNGNFKTAEGVEFQVKQVFGIEKRQDNGKDVVFIMWVQNNTDIGAQLTGMAGFWFDGNDMKVINFDSDRMPMCDLAGCSVKYIANLMGCSTSYDRKNPATFEVMYI